MQFTDYFIARLAWNLTWRLVSLVFHIFFTLLLLPLRGFMVNPSPTRRRRGSAPRLHQKRNPNGRW